MSSHHAPNAASSAVTGPADGQTTTIQHGIHLAARRIDWDFSRVPACPVEGDPNLAAFLLAISYFVVAFEDFGIPVVRAELEKLSDHPALAREAQTFISQEALHSQGHARLNELMKARHGIETKVIEREFSRFMNDMSWGSQQDQLAAVAALEHVIFSVAEWFEGAKDVQRAVHPEVNRLILWHAMEEIEHTAVVYDIYEHLYGATPGAYKIRIAALARGTRIAVRTLTRMWQSLVPQMVEKSGIPASKFIPWLNLAVESRKHLRDFFRFLSPNFSPWSNTNLIGHLPALRHQMAPAGALNEKWNKVRISAIKNVADDVISLDLVSLDGGSLAPWTAGAHIDVEPETGIVRQYSLCADPQKNDVYRVAVKRDPTGRGGSLCIHSRLQVGDTINISKPRNLFSLAEKRQEPEVILLAAGIGVTPLLSMAHALHAEQRPFTLHLFARNEQALPFFADIAVWPFCNAVRTHFGSKNANSRVDIGHSIPAWNSQKPLGLYICGPGSFLDSARKKADQAGWPLEHIHYEKFNQDAAPRADDKAFTLFLERSGVTMTVKHDQTIVEAMEASGLRVQTSCREGICGACVCNVLNGEVDHRDLVLTAAEHQAGHKIAPCVSRAKGSCLTLDL